MSTCIVILPKNLSDLGLDQDYHCHICLETVKENPNKPLFYHNDANGRKHPIHKDWCIDYSVATGKCAICKANVDLSSILSLRERFSNMTKQIAIDVAIRSVKFFLIALPASKIVDIFCNSMMHSNYPIGNALLGFSTGLFGAGNYNLTVFRMNSRNESNVVKITSAGLGALFIPLAIDFVTASDGGYYGALVALPFTAAFYYGMRRDV